MKRFWLVITALVIVNVVAALVLTLWIPAAAPAPPEAAQAPQGEALRPYPYVVVPVRTSDGFEHRVRSIVRKEFREMGGAANVENEPTLRFREPGVTRGTRSTGPRPPLVVATVSGPAPQPLATVEEETSVIPTPFGVFRTGIIGAGLALLSLGIMVAAGCLTLYFEPRRMRIVRDAVSAPWYRMLRFGAIGLLAYVLALAVAFVLVTLVVGAALAVLLLLIVAAATFVSLMSVSLAIGRWMRDRLALTPTSPVADLALGVLLLFPLGLIPWLGWVIVLGFASVGCGALITTKFGSARGWTLEAFSREGEYASLS